jgi:hypothetical protein
MSPVVRVLILTLVRLAFLFFAAWFALKEDALGEGTSLVSRFGIALLFLVAAILVAEVDKLRTHFGLLLGALRAAGTGNAASAVGAATAASQDPRASVDILVQALGAEDADTREKAHKHLVRLTGKNLPAEAALWERWWQENRDRFSGHTGPSA